MNSRFPGAVLWDMDGTIVDTEPYWMRAESELVRSFGGVWTHDDGLLLVGNGLYDSAAIIRGRGVDLAPDVIIDRLTARVQEQLAESIPWRPGAQELLREVRGAGIPTALVTMSMRPMAEQIAEGIPFPAFDCVVSGDQVANPKPQPDAYLEAAKRLRVDIHDCVAIEDSVTGLSAAVASGAVSIGVPHLVQLPESPEHTLWPTLGGKTLDDLVSVFTVFSAAGGGAQ